jgi:hypothetical protein
VTGTHSTHKEVIVLVGNPEGQSMGEWVRFAWLRIDRVASFVRTAENFMII